MTTAFDALSAVTVTLNATPAVALAGALIEKCVALCARLFSENVVVNEPFAVETLYAPVVALAVNAGAAAIPLPSVITDAEVVPLLNVPEAPLAGAVKVTPAPLIGLLLPSRTVAWSVVANVLFTVADCGVPAVAEMDAVAGTAGRMSDVARGTIW